MTGIRALRILVVDDEADLVATYRRLFRRQGYVVDSAVTRAGGLALLDAAAPDLVVADLELPDGGGGDLVRGARMRPAPPREVPIRFFPGKPVDKEEGSMNVNRIMVPLDGSMIAERALAPAA